MGEGEPSSSSEVLLKTLVGSFHTIVGSDVLWIGPLVPKPFIAVNPYLNNNNNITILLFSFEILYYLVKVLKKICHVLLQLRIVELVFPQPLVDEHAVQDGKGFFVYR